ncbi:hypothetical protein [Thalassospira australica]|uniref:hypothetical protein n=1 Tax=Thalassospira australica TaxID=1528106 RepID=UPI00384AD374
MADENENPPKDTPPAGGNPPDEQDAADPEKADDKATPAANAQGGAGGVGNGATKEGGDTPPANGGAAGGGGANSTPLSTALNPQIVQAVGTTNHAVLNGAGPGANGIAYQKVAQAAAYAVQDSTDYMRNIMSMASATTGVALQKMLVEKTTDPYADIIKAATQAVTDAQQTFTSVGTASSSVVKDFDSMA